MLHIIKLYAPGSATVLLNSGRPDTPRGCVVWEIAMPASQCQIRRRIHVESTNTPSQYRIPDQTMSFFLEYTLTRRFTVPYFTIGFVVFQVIWIFFITLVNFAAVGYESAPVFSVSFNSSNTLWYERFALTAFWLPKSWTCNPSTIQVGQGFP